MRRLLVSVVVFTSSALGGPIIRMLAWPPDRIEELMSPDAAEFLYYLVLFLWPAQPLAVAEVNTGRLVGWLIAIGGNALIFALVGGIVGVCRHRRAVLSLIYLGCCGALLLYALWGVSVTLTSLSCSALVLALALYAVPFLIVTRYAKGDSTQQVG